MSLKIKLLTGSAIIGLGVAPEVTTMLNSVETASASCNEQVTQINTRMINEAGTVKVRSGIFVSTYDSSGNIKDRRMAAPNSKWLTDQHIYVNGHFFFRIGVDTYLRDEDVIFSPS